jgi:hypothetical protein
MVISNVSFPDVKAALTRISKGEKATTSNVNAAQLMRYWLWGCDANEVCDRGKCDFHLMHLTGIVCVRVFTEAYHDTGDSPDVLPLIIDSVDINMLMAKSKIFLPHLYRQTPSHDLASKGDTDVDITAIPSCISLQQLRDLVHAVQTQWPILQKTMETERCPIQKDLILQTIDRLITQLFLWFGSFLFSKNLSSWQADDNDFLGTEAPSQNTILTEMGIKFYLNIFFVLFRLLFIQRHAVSVPVSPHAVSHLTDRLGIEDGIQNKPYSFEIETFHVEAGVDDFHTLGMYFDVPAGCLLEYKHSYSGYYNNVSQCVYRHFPAYKRRLPVSLDDILLKDAPDLSVLPALKQIYPEIEYAFEDHHFYREVGSVRTAVLLSTTSEKNPEGITKEATSTTYTVNSSHNIRSIVRSEKLLARIAACTGGTTDGESNGTEGSRGVKSTDWFWFIIGSNVYLIDTRDGVVYDGSCRDLLTFYLSTGLTAT